MALPKKLKYMNLFNEGESYLGQCGSVTLPKLTRKLEAWRGAGMDGAAKVDMGMGDDLDLEWTLGGIDATVIKQYGVTQVNGVMLRFAGSYQQDDTGDTIPVEVVTRGRHEEIDMGEAKPGEDTEHKIKTALSYYKLTVNGETLVEIDTVALIFKVDGTDMLAQHRANIGV